MGLVVDIGKVVTEKMVNDSISQLSVGLGKIIILVEDCSDTAIATRRIRMWGLDLREWRDWRLRMVMLLLVGRDLVKLGQKTVEKNWELYVEFKGEGRGFMELGKAGIRMMWTIGIKSVSSGGCGQRKQHQQPSRSDQTAVLGKRDPWSGRGLGG